MLTWKTNATTAWGFPLATTIGCAAIKLFNLVSAALRSTTAQITKQKKSKNPKQFVLYNLQLPYRKQAVSEPREPCYRSMSVMQRRSDRQHRSQNQRTTTRSTRRTFYFWFFFRKSNLSFILYLAKRASKLERSWYSAQPFLESHTTPQYHAMPQYRRQILSKTPFVHSTYHTTKNIKKTLLILTCILPRNVAIDVELELLLDDEVSLYMIIDYFSNFITTNTSFNTIPAKQSDQVGYKPTTWQSTLGHSSHKR